MREDMIRRIRQIDNEEDAHDYIGYGGVEEHCAVAVACDLGDDVTYSIDMDVDLPDADLERRSDEVGTVLDRIHVLAKDIKMMKLPVKRIIVDWPGLDGALPKSGE